MSSTKISVTLADSDVVWLRRRAAREHGGNLSAALSEAAGVMRQREAMRAFLDREGVAVLSPQELERITAEWRGARETKRAVRKKRRAA